MVTTQYWPALKLINQIAGELGLPQYTTVVGLANEQSVQLIAMLNSAGNELMTYYPWEQFRKEFTFSTVDLQGSYDLPTDYNYFVDQTQWDRTNHWPLSGPKTAQEWAWLKGGLVAFAPRTRFRVFGGKINILPIPGVGHVPQTMAMEYVSNAWLLGGVAQTTPGDMIMLDSDLLMYNPWLLIKYVKLKFMETKEFDTTAAQAEFMRMFNSLTGKDVGAPVLSMSGYTTPYLIGFGNIPDGSWRV